MAQRTDHQNDRYRVLLAELWATWAERGAALDAEQWGRATRLPGWSVRELYAHVAPTPGLFTRMREAVVDRPATVAHGSAVLRAYNRPDGVAHTAADLVADDARELAATVGTGALVARFATEGPKALAGIADLAPTTVIAHPLLGTATLGALAEVAVMEATVHLLDLTAAIGGPPPPDGALQATRVLLAEIADPVEFIEAAAGRTRTAVLPVIR
ncbi:maleylpyruvate isomerase N-terminal domain-containing protein [Kitasatospora sp. NPDC058201]|uniref:maleylpyruvate isomerase N-terminal domain-containing protein n=1 Tax=unclassified Kitasatospora TaxID=2633591 RepID=UPI0036536C6A